MTTEQAPQSGQSGRQTALTVFVWAWVTVPFCYGIYELVLKLRQLFTG